MKGKKSVVFILPEYVEIPMGGYKVVYEYSNKLAEDGFDVTILFPSFLYFSSSPLKRKLKLIFFFIYYSIFSRKGVKKWFPLNDKVKEKFVLTLEEKNIPEADLYFATALETADLLNRCKKVSQEKKYYLIQAVEDWRWGLDAFIQTLKYDMTKISVSPWLQTFLSSYGEDSVLIENGVDRKMLKRETDPEKRDKFLVMMLYHKQKLKAAKDGFMALNIVKEKYPELKSIWFGCPNKPSDLPDWIEYYQQPNEYELNVLYNKSAIYIGPSHSEGFGLTVGEAMSCGCAVACTDTGGYLTMAKHKETALVSPIKDVPALAVNIIELIENDKLRYEIAEKGYDNIKQFTWEIAYKKLRKLIG